MELTCLEQESGWYCLWPIFRDIIPWPEKEKWVLRAVHRSMGKGPEFLREQRGLRAEESGEASRRAGC